MATTASSRSDRTEVGPRAPGAARAAAGGEDRDEPHAGAADVADRLTAWALYGGTLAAALAAPSVARRLRRRLPAALADTATNAALAGSGWAAVAVLERRRPFRPAWNQAQGDVLTDLLSLVVTGGLAQLGGDLLAAPARRRLAAPGRNLGRVTRRLPRPAQLVLTVGGFDLFHTAQHRAAHEHAALWPVHAVHHSAPRLYWLNATRFHLLEMLLDGVVERLWLAVLGVDADTILAHRTLRAIYGQVQHGNVAVDSGRFGAVLSTPERHRWHHAADPATGNANYGAVTCLWDRLWGTDGVPGRPFDAALGNGDPAYPTDWVHQQLAPFRRRSRPASGAGTA